MSLCYLHGWGLNGDIWSPLLADLAGETPDLPGYGETPSVLPYTAEALADSVASSLRKPVDLVGWSMGGMVALALAARYPAKVSKLVLVDTSPCFVGRGDWAVGLEAQVLATFADDLQRDFRATLQRFLSLQARGGDSARAVVGRLRETVLARQEPRAEVLAAGLQLLQDVDIRDLAGQVRCPTLVLHGAHDTLCPVAAGEWLAERIEGAALAVHAHAAHAPFISHPEWFVATVKAFLHDA